MIQLTTLHGLTFPQVVRLCLENSELVANYDRLRGTNVALRGSPIDCEIDMATGKHADELQSFIAFVKDCVWDRIPVRHGSTSDAL